MHLRLSRSGVERCPILCGTIVAPAAASLNTELSTHTEMWVIGESATGRTTVARRQRPDPTIIFRTSSSVDVRPRSTLQQRSGFRSILAATPLVSLALEQRSANVRCDVSKLISDVRTAICGDLDDRYRRSPQIATGQRHRRNHRCVRDLPGLAASLRRNVPHHPHTSVQPTKTHTWTQPSHPPPSLAPHSQAAVVS